MKKAKDIAEDAYNMDRDEEGNNVFYEWNVVKAIEEAQEDAIKATLKLAAERARVLRTKDEIVADELGHAREFRIVDEHSILSLEDELIKTINNE